MVRTTFKIEKILLSGCRTKVKDPKNSDNQIKMLYNPLIGKVMTCYERFDAITKILLYEIGHKRIFGYSMFFDGNSMIVFVKYHY